jgi:hypothetical protein
MENSPDRLGVADHLNFLDYSTNPTSHPLGGVAVIYRSFKFARLWLRLAPAQSPAVTMLRLVPTGVVLCCQNRIPFGSFSPGKCIRLRRQVYTLDAHTVPTS